MPKAPSPPVIEGTLKEPICAMSFGILVSMWSMNIGSLLTPNYFAYIVGTVIAFECVLWLIDKPRQEYEVYQPPSRESWNQETLDSKPTREAAGENKGGKGHDDGAKAKRIGLHSPGQQAGEGKVEKSDKASRFRFRQKKNVESPESPTQ